MPVFTLHENPKISTSYSSPSGTYEVDDYISMYIYPTQTGYENYRWRIIGIEGEGVETIINNANYSFRMPNNDVDAYPLCDAVEYTITYNNMEGATASNPSTYTIDTPTFTLSRPTKGGSSFIGWTDERPPLELDMTIPQGSTGDKVYYANWESATNIIAGGQSLVKRMIDGHEVEKVMYNGNQIRPASGTPYILNVDFRNGIPTGWNAASGIASGSDGIYSTTGEKMGITHSLSFTDIKRIELVSNFYWIPSHDITNNPMSQGLISGTSWTICSALGWNWLGNNRWIHEIYSDGKFYRWYQGGTEGNYTLKTYYMLDTNKAYSYMYINGDIVGRIRCDSNLNAIKNSTLVGFSIGEGITLSSMNLTIYQ